MFEAIDARQDQGALDDGDQPVVSMPAPTRVRERAAQARPLVVSESDGRTDTVARRRARAAARRSPGARRTARSRIPSAASRASAASCRRPARPGRTGGSSATSPGAWATGEAFAYRSAAAIFREHAALSAFENNGTRDFDIGALERHQRRGYRRDSAGAMAAAEARRRRPKGGRGSSRTGGFYTFDRRARFVAVAAARRSRRTPARPIRFVLNTGRVRDQWHTMTRTGRSQRLSAHRPCRSARSIPTMPARSASWTGDSAGSRASTARPSSRSMVDRGRAPGQPVHADALERRHRLEGPGRRAGARRARSRLRPARAEGDARRIAPRAPTAPAASCSPATSARRPPDGGGRAATILGGSALQFATQDGSREIALMMRGAFQGLRTRRVRRPCPRPLPLRRLRRGAPRRLPVAGARRGEARLGGRQGAVRGGLSPRCRCAAPCSRAAPPRPLAGPTVCACHGVGLDVITGVIAAGAGSVEAVGAACKAGTNCGSCIPEIRKLLPEPLARRRGLRAILSRAILCPRCREAACPTAPFGGGDLPPSRHRPRPFPIRDGAP